MSRSRPSFIQMEKLIQFLENNPGIATGHVRSAQAGHQTKLKWDEITLELNSMGGTIKDSESWAKFWADKIYALKKLISQRNASARRSGGDIGSLQPLTELDERMLSLMGGASFADGDQELSVPLNLPEHEINASASVSQERREEDEEINQIYIIPTPTSSQQTTDQTQPAGPSSAQQPSLPSTPTRPLRRQRNRRRPTHLQNERQRLIRIEEKRVQAEVANAAGWQDLVEAINSGAEKIANALMHTNNK